MEQSIFESWECGQFAGEELDRNDTNNRWHIFLSTDDSNSVHHLQETFSVVRWTFLFFILPVYIGCYKKRKILNILANCPSTRKRQINIAILEWPAMSSDANLIENVWSYIKMKLKVKPVYSVKHLIFQLKAVYDTYEMNSLKI